MPDNSPHDISDIQTLATDDRLSDTKPAQAESPAQSSESKPTPDPTAAELEAWIKENEWAQDKANELSALKNNIEGIKNKIQLRNFAIANKSIAAEKAGNPTPEAADIPDDDKLQAEIDNLEKQLSEKQAAFATISTEIIANYRDQHPPKTDGAAKSSDPAAQPNDSPTGAVTRLEAADNNAPLDKLNNLLVWRQEKLDLITNNLSALREDEKTTQTAAVRTEITQFENEIAKLWSSNRDRIADQLTVENKRQIDEIMIGQTAIKAESTITEPERIGLVTDAANKLEKGESLTPAEILLLAQDLVDKGLDASVARAKVLSLTGKATFTELLADRGIKAEEVGLPAAKDEKLSRTWLLKATGKIVATGLIGGTITLLTGGAGAVFWAGMAGSSLATLGIEKWRDVSERKWRKQEIEGLVENARESQQIALELMTLQEKEGVAPNEINQAMLKLVNSLQANSEKALEARKTLSGWKHNLKWAAIGAAGSIVGAGAAIGARELLTGAYHEMVKRAISQAEAEGRQFAIRNHLVQYAQGLWHWVINGSDVATAAASHAPLHGVGGEIGKAAVGQAHLETAKTAATGIMNAEVYKIITQEVIHKYLAAGTGLLIGMLSGEGIRSLWQGLSEAKKTAKLEGGSKLFSGKLDLTKTKPGLEFPTEPAPSSPSSESEAVAEAEPVVGKIDAKAEGEKKETDAKPEKIEALPSDELTRLTKYIEGAYGLTNEKFIRLKAGTGEIEDIKWLKKDTKYRFIGINIFGNLVFEEETKDGFVERRIDAERLLKLNDEEKIIIFKPIDSPIINSKAKSLTAPEAKTGNLEQQATEINKLLGNDGKDVEFVFKKGVDNQLFIKSFTIEKNVFSDSQNYLFGLQFIQEVYDNIATAIEKNQSIVFNVTEASIVNEKNPIIKLVIKLP